MNTVYFSLYIFLYKLLVLPLSSNVHYSRRNESNVNSDGEKKHH